MWDPGDLPTRSFLQMVHHQPGELFCAGKEGHYPLLQGCPKAPKRHKAWQVEHRVNPHLSSESLYDARTRTAGHRSLALPNASQVLGRYSAQDFRNHIRSPY